MSSAEHEYPIEICHENDDFFMENHWYPPNMLDNNRW